MTSPATPSPSDTTPAAIEPSGEVTGEVLLAEFEDTRDDGPMTGNEREVLTHWLDLYRDTVLHKVSGLTAAQLCERSVPPSSLSLIGTLRHLTEVEAYWLREVLLTEDLPDYYCTEESRDGDFDDIDPATAAADIAAYRRELDICRAIVDEWPDLDAPVAGRRRGKEVNLRWILTHLIEEYARHAGHMDLLRERVDGRTGY